VRSLRSSVAATAVLALIAFVALEPDFLVSVDGAIKLLQAQSLLESGFTSVAIPYPAEALDPSHEHVPFGPPFVFEHAGQLQGVYPTAVAIISAPFLLLGLPGLTVFSLLSALVALWASAALVQGAGRVWVPFLLAFGTHFWAYAVLPWEHMPALACSTVAFVMLREGLARTVGAGLLLGLAMILRHETVLLLPWFVLARGRLLPWRTWLTFGAALLVPFVVVGGLDALLLDRPAFAHLAHAVDLVWNLVSDQAIERPLDLTFRQHAELISSFWLFGFPALLGATLTAALAIWYVSTGSEGRAGVVVTALVMALVLAGRDLAAFAAQPEFIAGIVRNAPFLLLAVLPGPPRALRPDGRSLELAALLLYLLGLFGSTRDGGVQVGPRFLLPVMPLAVKLAWENLQLYWSASGNGLTRLVAPLACAAVLLSLLVQGFINLPTLSRLEREEHGIVKALASAQPKVVIITHDIRLINLVAPIYHDANVMAVPSNTEIESLLAVLPQSGEIAVVQPARFERWRPPVGLRLVREYSSPSTHLTIVRPGPG
jgi:hypothetical protein